MQKILRLLTSQSEKRDFSRPKISRLVLLELLR
jgi:hypothetical protein